jgi:plastocyanin
MRKLVLLGVLAGALAGATATTAADQTITISAAGFVPRNVTVNVGDTVTWANMDTKAHQVIVDRTTCNFTVQPASTGTCTFRTAGGFNYREPSQSGQAWRGRITVRAAALSVTIAASPSVVSYNGATTLSGMVSNGQTNERVTVQAQPCGVTAFSALATVSTTTGGAWTVAARPAKTTVYQAKWRTATGAATVRVRPRVTLRKLTGGRFAVRVSAAQSFAGKVVVFQRFNATQGVWVRVRFVVLKAMGGTAPTAISGANFRARVKAGTRVRAVIGSTQVAPCYVAGTSNVVRR